MRRNRYKKKWQGHIIRDRIYVRQFGYYYWEKK